MIDECYRLNYCQNGIDSTFPNVLEYLGAPISHILKNTLKQPTAIISPFSFKIKYSSAFVGNACQRYHSSSAGCVIIRRLPFSTRSGRWFDRLTLTGHPELVEGSW
jgi:hypothetical protein